MKREKKKESKTLFFVFVLMGSASPPMRCKVCVDMRLFWHIEILCLCCFETRLQNADKLGTRENIGPQQATWTMGHSLSSVDPSSLVASKIV